MSKVYAMVSGQIQVPLIVEAKVALHDVSPGEVEKVVREWAANADDGVTIEVLEVEVTGDERLHELIQDAVEGGEPFNVDHVEVTDSK